MKRLLTLMLGTLLFSNACNDSYVTPKSGRMSFMVNSERNSTGGKVSTIEGITKIFINIETADGESVHQLKELTLLEFAGSFISEELSLPAGSYRITGFFAANNDNEVLYATPLDGSELAPLVNNPLPVNFLVEANQVTPVEMEVVNVSDHQPDDFGYAAFILSEATRSLVKIVAHTGDITNINRVRTWIMNTETYERQWINLQPDNTVAGKWTGQVVLPNNDYEIETFVEHGIPKQGLILAQAEKKTLHLDKSVTLTFSQIDEQTPRRLKSSEHFTVLIPTDPCDFTYSLYLHNDVSSVENFLLDRAFWSPDEEGQVISYTAEGSPIGTAEPCTEEEGCIPNTGSIHRTLPPISNCEPLVQQSGDIDCFMLIAGTLKSGQPAAYTNFIYVYKTDPTAGNGKMNSVKSFSHSERMQLLKTYSNVRMNR